MDWLRTSLIAGIVLTCFLLLLEWNKFQERQQPQIAAEETVASTIEPPEAPAPPAVQMESELPVVEDIPLPEVQSVITEKLPVISSSQLVRVETDSLIVLIDTLGGDIVKVALPKHYAKLDSPEQPFILLNRTESHTYIAQSGLVGPNGIDAQGKRPIYHSASLNYSLAENQDSITVDLELRQDKVDITKRFTFSRDSYLIKVEFLINNGGDTSWAANVFGQIKRDTYRPDVSSGFGMQPYLGAAITTPETNYKKIKFNDLVDKPFKIHNTGGWVAMVQHYFMSAWIPEQSTTNHFNLRKSRNKDLYLLGFTGPQTSVAPGASVSIPLQFYAGPKYVKTLESIAPYLDLTVDYGWFWWIAKPLFYTLDFIHGWVGNWGVAIILLTVLIKLFFFYPSAASYRSMAKLRKVQPLMADLKDRYGDNRQKMSEEMMKLYRTEKVNPLGGCLPMLIQMPVFIALYWALFESVELRHAPFFFWLQDLSIKDPLFILPLIMGVTMWFQQKLNPAPADPMQAKVMQMLPIFFTFLFLFFPAGLVLYWVVNNILSIAQQYIITRQIENA